MVGSSIYGELRTTCESVENVFSWLDVSQYGLIEFIEWSWRWIVRMWASYFRWISQYMWGRRVRWPMWRDISEIW